MTVEQRIRTCLLIEKMHEQKAYSEKPGLVNTSKFHGEKMNEEEEKQIC